MNEALQEWLSRLCEELEGSSGGLLALGKAAGPFDPAATWPSAGATPSPSLLGAVRVALGSSRPVIQSGGAATAGGTGRDVLAVPFQVPGDPVTAVRGAVAVEVPHRDANTQQPGVARLQEALRHLPVVDATVPAPDPALLDDLRPGAQDPLLELVARVLVADSVPGAARAAATGLARLLNATRVGIGLCDANGGVRLVALSDSERFDPRVDWVTAREAAMLEALDQGAAVSYPPLEPAPPATAAHARLVQGKNTSAVHTALMRARGVAGRVIGAITAELEPVESVGYQQSAPAPAPVRDTRGAGSQGAAGAAAIEQLGRNTTPLSQRRRTADPGGDGDSPRTLERAAAVLGPVLHARQLATRTLMRHLRDAARHRLEPLFGPGHLRTKVVAAGLIVAGLLLAMVPATFRVSAPAHIQGSVQRAVVAPVDGFIALSRARAGDLVKRGELLGSLDSTELELERKKWLGTHAQLTKAIRAAMAAGDRSEVTILRARLDQTDAELALVKEQLARTRLLAPFDGVVARGDLSQLLGSPVERGQILFEVAPLDKFRVDVKVDERDIAYVTAGQAGRLSLASLPDEALSFRVARITPIANTDEDGSYFLVEAELNNPLEGLRPGMEGIARVDVGRRSLLWIWTRRITEWLRLVVWSWLP